MRNSKLLTWCLAHSRPHSWGRARRRGGARARAAWPGLAALLVLALTATALAQTKPEPRPVRKGRATTVEIESAPQQAAIYLDDERYGVVGYTPWKGRLVYGGYRLILVKEGYQRLEVDIRVDRKSRRFLHGLEREIKPAKIGLTDASDANVRGAKVRVDGQERGVAPLEVEVAPGRHQVELARDGYEPFSQWVEVAAGQTLTLAPALKPIAAAPGSILVDANVRGAAVAIDGRAHPDPTPTVIEGVKPGPHVIEVRAGAVPAWKATVEVRSGERAKVMAELQVPKAAPATGSLLVDASTAGASVTIDGRPHGDPAPTVIEGLAPGPHVVEVRKAGFAPWKGTATVIAGQRVKVLATLTAATAAAPAAPVRLGTLIVRASAPDAEVLLDGRPMGKAPVKIGKVVAGPHALAARTAESAGEAVVVAVADQTVETTITLRTGHQLSPVALGKVKAQAPKASGKLEVRSTPPGAQVLVAGKVVGLTPVALELAVGSYPVEVRAAGRATHQQQAAIRAGETTTIAPALAAGGGLRVRCNVDGARASLGAFQLGPTPVERADVPTGRATLRVEAPGYAVFVHEVFIEAGKTTPVEATLRPVGAAAPAPGDVGLGAVEPGPGGATAPAAAASAGRMLSSWGGRVLPYGALTLDLGTGYPWYVEARGTAGLLRDPILGIDASMHIRSSFLRTEGLVSMRFRLAEGGPFGAAAFVGVGGGSGVADRDSFVFQGGVLGTVFFGDRVALTARALIDVWSDRLCPSKGSDAEKDGKSGPDICRATIAAGSWEEDRVKELIGSTKLQDRDTGVRLTVSAVLEIALSQGTNLYLLIDGSPAQAERASLTRMFHEAMIFTRDPVLAGKAGLTFKF
jgi:hypothetical protein